MDILHRRIGRIGYATGVVLSTLLILTHFWPSIGHRAPVGDRPDLLAIALAYIAFGYLLAAWRCHDFGKSGWHDFWNNQIPIVGGLISLFELFFKPGDPRANSYGKPPRF
jgi:uncharacterized membrane protein YhaH (DUF805 family)